MTFKQQLIKVKENWLIVLLIFVVLIIMLSIGGISSQFSGLSRSYSNVNYDMSKQAPTSYGGYAGQSNQVVYPTPSTDFAPGVKERKLIRNSNLGLSVENRQFDSAEARLKAIVTSSGSYLLNENVNRYGTGKDSYRAGYYQIKVEKEKYDSVVVQLKDIGEVSSFNENTVDITGEYVNNEIELGVEQERLARYKEMYAKATIVADQITINDRIFDEERTIQYLQDSLKNKNQQVDYSQISVSLNEKQSGYANLALVKLSDLIHTLVASTNALFYIAFALVPFAAAAAIIWLIVWLIKRR